MSDAESRAPAQRVAEADDATKKKLAKDERAVAKDMVGTLQEMRLNKKIVDKMVDGRMRNYYAQCVLTEQPFVKDDKQSVGKVAIQGDQDISFEILERVMYTCNVEGYADISLAVVGTGTS